MRGGWVLRCIGLVSVVVCCSHRRWPVVAVGWVLSWALSLVMLSPWSWFHCHCHSPLVVLSLSPCGCWVLVSLAASIDPCWPIAPPIHPMSSCSQWWRWVLGRVLVLVPPIIVPFFCGCWCHSCVVVVVLWSCPSFMIPLASTIPPCGGGR